MKNDVYERMRSHPKFAELTAKRGRYAWTLAFIVLAAFYGFVMLVAFTPALLGAPIAEGSRVTIGVLVELLMFIGFWGLTWLYVRRANGEFDALTRDIIRDATKGAQQ